MPDGRWSSFLEKVYPAKDYASRIGTMEIKEIRISREARTWEISFYSRFLPGEAEREQILSAFRQYFGEDIEYCLHTEEARQEIHLLEKLKSALAQSQACPPGAGLTQACPAGTVSGETSPAGTVPAEVGEEILLNRRLREKQKGTQGKKKGPALILGRKISGEARRIADIGDESRNTVIDAVVFRVNEQRLLKAGTKLCDFDVTDYSGSIKVKIFLDAKQQEKIREDWLKEGARYRMKGSVRYDSFQKELCFFPDDVSEGEEKTRKDAAVQKRVELHLHTKLSAMDATVSTEELIRQAAAWGHGAVAITDHGVVQAFPEAMKAAAKVRGKAKDKSAFKVIYGMEGYLIEGDGAAFMESVKKRGKKAGERKGEPGGGDEGEAERQDGWHILLLAKNMTGIKNLYELVSLSHLHYFYRKPRIPRQALARLREGLVVGSACESGELFQQILAGADEAELEATASFYDFLEIQPVQNNAFLIRGGRAADEEVLRDWNRRILRLGRRLGKPVAATGDVHFLLPEDEVLRRILQAGQGYRDADTQPPLYLRTTEEMLEEFAYLGEEEAFRVVVEATGDIAAQVEDLQPIPETLSPPRLDGAREAVEGMVRQKAAALYGEPLPEWIGLRLEREIRSITEYGYADLYYIAHKLVKHSTENGFLVGSRGSVGSSLVAYLADITEVNPLAPHYRCPSPSCRMIIPGDTALYGCGADMPEALCPRCASPMRKEGFNIPFEVFLGFEGDKAPDIDLNFSGEYQTQAQKYTEELFGRENVFKAGTVIALAEKTAFGFVRNYFAAKGAALRAAEAERLVRGLTGIRRTTSQHPGGIVVLPKGDEIINYTPVQRPADDADSEFVTTHFDYHAIDKCLVKLDILGHDAPTIIRLLVDMTGKDIGEIPLDDPAVLSLFRSPEALGIDAASAGIETGSLGVPEFGTGFVRGMLTDTRPSAFSDLVRISGFSHGTDVWLGNARDILKENLGTLKEVISCRDDIMLRLIQAGVNPHHAFKIMERVRKGGGLSREDIEAMEITGVPDWYIASCQKIKYLFPKAHAVAYVTMAFHIAWFKVFAPLAFYAATFSVREGLDGSAAAAGREKLEEAMGEIRAKRERKEASGADEDRYTAFELAREMLLRGFSFLPVSLEKSGAGRYLIEDGNLRLPFTSLPGLGLAAANGIVEGREEKPYHSVEDLRRRGKAGSALIGALREHGALADLPESDQQSLFS